jgi:hypothetical protein
MNNSNKRTTLIVASAMDTVLSGIVLLLYFNLLPIDLSSWGIPRWAIGVVGGLWFLISIGILAYQLTKPDIE